MRSTAARRSSGSFEGSAKRAIASAMVRRGMPYCGSPQPSIPRGAMERLRPVMPSKAARTRCCAGCSGRMYPRVGSPRCTTWQSIPVCLPEQLLCALLGDCPARSIAWAAGSYTGRWLPHSRSAAVSPSRSSHASTTRTCSGSPPWEPQAMESSASPRPKRSAAPLSTSGRACSGLMAERPKMGSSGSPQAATTLPWTSTAMAEPV